MKDSTVKVWEEKICIPTYATGMPDKNPMFFEKRVYQGSSGVVYPNPVIEKIFDEKQDREYNAVFLENDYIIVMILPELGGRIQMAYDKLKKRHFVYFNQVIKPALVGLTGPWISGGIEFNWPQHHRPSTFEPVDFKITDNPDGSKTVWVNEIEKMFHTKGLAGFTLYPERAYIEIQAKLYNGSELPQTFLWWANPAVKVNDDYQSVFPPDVNAVFDHGKRDVSNFPIATGTYYKVDYSPGTDISRYKNIPVPTSYMATDSEYDFVGGYEHDSKSGLLHVADHHLSPGKKQWTWGHGDFGKAWDRQLTDNDGPYIELMTGVFTDNQPDFTWLMPHEQKTFKQYFMPYRELGVVKNATKDILLSVAENDQGIVLKVFSTSKKTNVQINLTYNGLVLLSTTQDLSPENVFEQVMAINGDYDESQLSAIITSNAEELLRYEPRSDKKKPIPKPAEPAMIPAEVENNEQLFLTGQHLEQYRHATYSPVEYYKEALRRDPYDLRNNNALGVWHLRRGNFATAEYYLKKGVEAASRRNPNPYDGEPYYNLGLCVKYLKRPDEAYALLYKASWSSVCKGSSYTALGQIDLIRGRYQSALEHLCIALDNNSNNNKAYVLKASALRILGSYDEAIATANQALHRDSFNLGALFELTQLMRANSRTTESMQYEKELIYLSRSEAHNFLEYAFDYAAAGLYKEAADLLILGVDNGAVSPMVYYALALFNHRINQETQARNWLDKAASEDAYLCFPNRLAEIEVLEYAIKANPTDSLPAYYLGNLFYDKRQYERAIGLWEYSLSINHTFPTVLRNLGLAYFNKHNDPKKALNCYEKAFDLDNKDARVLMELDQLRKRMNHSPADRLAYLEKHLKTVIERDDLYLERVALYNLFGEYQIGLELIMARKFHPWEGGEGKVAEQYLQSLLGLAIKNYYAGEYALAIEQLEQAQRYPDNLGEGKLFGMQENDIFYWLGCIYKALGKVQIANDFFRKASTGSADPKTAVFYNDQKPDKMLYQGLALQQLGKKDQAHKLFEKLITYGAEHIDDEVKMDYFAVSLPDLLIFEDDLVLRNRLDCIYLQALGHSGLENYQKANELFAEILIVNQAHLGSRFEQRRLDNLKYTSGSYLTNGNTI